MSSDITTGLNVSRASDGRRRRLRKTPSRAPARPVHRVIVAIGLGAVVALGARRRPRSLHHAGAAALMATQPACADQVLLRRWRRLRERASGDRQGRALRVRSPRRRGRGGALTFCRRAATGRAATEQPRAAPARRRPAGAAARVSLSVPRLRLRLALDRGAHLKPTPSPRSTRASSQAHRPLRRVAHTIERTYKPIEKKYGSKRRADYSAFHECARSVASPN